MRLLNNSVLPQPIHNEPGTAIDILYAGIIAMLATVSALLACAVIA